MLIKQSERGLQAVLAEAERLAQDIMQNPPLSVRANVRASRWFAVATRTRVNAKRKPGCNAPSCAAATASCWTGKEAMPRC